MTILCVVGCSNISQGKDRKGCKLECTNCEHVKFACREDESEIEFEGKELTDSIEVK